MRKILTLLIVTSLLMLLANYFSVKFFNREKVTDAGARDPGVFFESQSDQIENNGRVKIVTGDMGNGTIKVSVQAEDMQRPILGFSFQLDYPSDILSYLKYERGDFIERGGEPFYMVENGKNDRGNGDENGRSDGDGGGVGKIIFGSTLKRGDTFPIGDGNIVDFYFKISDPIFDTAGLNFKFKNPIASTLLNTKRQDINKIEWVSMAK